ncbi:uncharacterized protein TNCV_608091 [Trichonephila clavipes]|nr:uncharacterized protein TNCV_608091 [Trichonephila clavipes]
MVSPFWIRQLKMSNHQRLDDEMTWRIPWVSAIRDISRSCLDPNDFTVLNLVKGDNKSTYKVVVGGGDSLPEAAQSRPDDQGVEQVHHKRESAEGGEYRGQYFRPIHISSDSDDGYDPGTNDLELFSRSDLNDLERDLGLPKDTAEVLGYRLKERHLLNSGVSFSWYRFREKEFVPFLRQQSGYTKFPCFLCEWDSRDMKQHYAKQTWPIRKALIPRVQNVERQSLVDPKKILFPPLHIKLGLMKQFVKALHKEGE